jgi:hypothetical protein
MTPITLALLIFGIMLLLMVIRVPIAGAMFWPAQQASSCRPA